MRVTAFIPGLDEVGGAELLAVEQMRFLASRGVNAQFVTFDYAPEFWGRKILDGADVRRVRTAWVEKLAFGDRLRKLRIRGRLASRHLRDADVVVAYNYPSSAMLGESRAAAAKLWHCCEPSRALHLVQANPELFARAEAHSDCEARCILDFREMLASWRRRGALESERRWDREAVSRLDGAIAISEYSAELLVRAVNRKPDAIIYPMVRFPHRVARRSGLRGDGLRVLLHTRLHVSKNADTVLRGFALYRASRDSRATLEIVGEGDERPALMEMAVKLGLENSVRFHGFLQQKDLEEIYRRCEVMAFLPVDEPFGMVFPEAAARGLLLIGPDHGGPLEILDGGRLGTAVDAFSAAALAEALGEVASSSTDEIDRRREATDRACRTRYDRELLGQMLMAVLRKLH